MDGTDRAAGALETLAARVDALEAACERLTEENSRLRAAAGGSGAAEPRDGEVSRRGLLRGVAAAGAAGVALASPELAAASDGNAVTAGQVTFAEHGTSIKYDGTFGFTGVVLLANDTGFDNSGALFPAALGGWASASGAGRAGVANGVYGYTENDKGNAIVGVNTGGTAVRGRSDSTASSATAIIGVLTSTNPGGFSAAVRGQNNGQGGAGIGVWGSQAGSGWGGYFTSASGIGVVASGGTGTGVSASGTTGVSASGATAVSASGSTTGVAASSSGGSAVTAQISPGSAPALPTSRAAVAAQAGGGFPGIAGTSDTLAGVWGVSDTGNGVRGTSNGGAAVRGNSNNGNGVTASSTNGYGVQAQGGLAQLYLVPGRTAGAPATGDHRTGELFLDKNGLLFLCVRAGTPGTWKQVNVS